MALPKRIVFFWAQGAKEAPSLVRRCWRAWEEKNPGWEIVIADSFMAQKAFATAKISQVPKTVQGQADIFRVIDLAAHGGVYVDAATIPIVPLDEWIHGRVAAGAFAFHDPYRRRSVENWFLACIAGDAIMEGWADHMRSYWDRPRVVQTRKRSLDTGLTGAWSAWRDARGIDKPNGAAGTTGRLKRVIEPRDRIWAVDPNGGAQRPLHPYFWPHYLFDLMLHNDPELREAWAQMPKIPSYKELMIRHWKHRYAQMTDNDIDTLMAGSQMQKLALNKTPSLAQMSRIFEVAGLSAYNDGQL